MNNRRVPAYIRAELNQAVKLLLFSIKITVEVAHHVVLDEVRKEGISA